MYVHSLQCEGFPFPLPPSLFLTDHTHVIRHFSIFSPFSQATNVAVFALKDFESIQKVFKRVKDHCAEILSAFEFFDSHAFDLISKHGVKDPFSEKFPFYVLIETSGSRGEHDEEVSSILISSCLLFFTSKA